MAPVSASSRCMHSKTPPQERLAGHCVDASVVHHVHGCVHTAQRHVYFGAKEANQESGVFISVTPPESCHRQQRLAAASSQSTAAPISSAAAAAAAGIRCVAGVRPPPAPLRFAPAGAGSGAAQDVRAWHRCPGSLTALSSPVVQSLRPRASKGGGEGPGRMSQRVGG